MKEKSPSTGKQAHDASANDNSDNNNNDNDESLEKENKQASDDTSNTEKINVQQQQQQAKNGSSLQNDLKKQQKTLFPCKRLFLKTFDRIYIIMTQETLYHAVLNETLFHSKLACDLSALLQLIDSCNSQDLLETVIAYFALLQDKDKGALKTPEDVDKYCEQMLKDKFGTNINVEVNDSMKKLKTLGLMEERPNINNDSQSPLTVKPLIEGIDCVHRHWMNFTSSFRQLHNIIATAD
ncbi:hypothetical protein RFI_21921 [Reticulomyxa filosa]|uniref:Uncharacterized protein n=1 Tax=Reticulomyxa filosa TaxID=46433 RepID=X6MN86_RETFI|nr:hypothetical protein RFI_21921 [Reticulomyxa filosa]|eukprot:ETO15443.1 hypothetical protein RFI_21921 [Reticulomyxa filosa]